MRRELGDEVEFQTLMWFDGLEAIKRFHGRGLCGEPCARPAAQAVLARFDERAAHYEVLDRRPQTGQ